MRLRHGSIDPVDENFGSCLKLPDEAAPGSNQITTPNKRAITPGEGPTRAVSTQQKDNQYQLPVTNHPHQVASEVKQRQMRSVGLSPKTLSAKAD